MIKEAIIDRALEQLIIGRWTPHFGALLQRFADLANMTQNPGGYMVLAMNKLDADEALSKLIFEAFRQSKTL